MRETAKQDFLRRAGWENAAIAPLAGDASNRRYDRLRRSNGEWAVLMDAPPERGEALAPFLAIGARLNDLGFSAPRTIAADLTEGFAVIEDLGDDLYARACAADPQRETPLYAAAVDLLAALASTPPRPSFHWDGVEFLTSPYDAKVLLREAALAVDWWAPLAADAWSDDASAEFGDLVATAVEPVSEARGALVLRDYHAENLLWLPEREGHARVGLLDYQDALIGHPAYDLVSLLEDARRDTGDALRAAMIDRFVSAAAIADPEAFLRDYAILGAQRNLKIIGIFARLRARDGKDAYLDLLPRVWAHLRRDLAHPHLSDLRRFVERWLPEPTPEAIARVRARN
ncbi:MAG: phosphotransferase [Pseudomonadota bacterium]